MSKTLKGSLYIHFVALHEVTDTVLLLSLVIRKYFIKVSQTVWYQASHTPKDTELKDFTGFFGDNKGFNISVPREKI